MCATQSDETLVVSLGGWCGVRGVIREMGLGGANMPFDWGRSSLDGVVHCIRTEFHDFLSYDSVVQHSERTLRVERDYLHDSADESILPFANIYVTWSHSFWHDDLDLPEEREKYHRRIARFQALRSGGFTPVLFVRAANATTELAGVHRLDDLLQEHFSGRAFLLLLVSHQPVQGPLLFEDRPSLMVYTLGKAFDNEGLHGMKPLYREAISAGIAWMQNGADGQRRLPSLSALLCNFSDLVEEVSLGEDLTTQWVHISVPAPNPHALGLAAAVDLHRRGTDVRRCPYDGLLYVLDGFRRSCEPYWSRSEVLNYWKNECESLHLEPVAGAVCGFGLTSVTSAQDCCGPPPRCRSSLGEFQPRAQVVSLGSHCGLKHSLIHMGLSSATFPFDWVRSTLSGVLVALRSDFHGFEEYSLAVPHYERPRVLSDEEEAADDYTPFEVVYACEGHAIWHTICWDQRGLETCKRRAERFLQMKQDQHRRPLLFVRSASSGSELHRLGELLDLLVSQFGDVFLLLLLTSQPSHEYIAFADQPRLLVATIGSDCNMDDDCSSFMSHFEEAIWNAMGYVQRGKHPAGVVHLRSSDALREAVGTLFADDVDLGEDILQRWSPSDKQERSVHASHASSSGAVAVALGTSRAWTCRGRRRNETSTVRAISLGSWCGVKAAISELGFLKENLPFDWLRSSLRGVLHLVATDFSDFFTCDHVVPRGAPDDCHVSRVLFSGFPGVPKTHDIWASWGWSFWYEDLGRSCELAKYERRVRRFQRLQRISDSASPSLLLFVHALSSTLELSYAGELHALLRQRFGVGRAHLLIVVDHQPSQRMHVFHDRPDFMLHTLRPVGCTELSAMLPAYACAINAAHEYMLSGVPGETCREVATFSEFLGSHEMAQVVLEDDITKQWSPSPKNSAMCNASQRSSIRPTSWTPLQTGETHHADSFELVE